MKTNEFILNCVNFENTTFEIRVKYTDVIIKINDISQMNDCTDYEIDMFYCEFNKDGSLTYVLLINPNEYNK